MPFTEQEKTLKDLCRKLKKYHKCAMIRPTGFGKTYALSQLISKYKTVLYIYPTAVIRDTVIGNFYSNASIDRIDEDGNAIDPETVETVQKLKSIPNCTLMTYAKLQRMAKKDWKKMPVFDLIIFDELHRMGGQKTKSAVNRLMVAYPDAHIAGATATPTRMDNFDPVSVFFSDIMCYPYTMVDAINDGILQKSNYVFCTYDYETDFKEAALTAGQDPKDPVVQKVLKAHIIEAAKILSMDKVIKKTCDKYAADTNYMKFIVFFASVQHMDEQLEEVKGWFRKAYPRHTVDSLMITSRSVQETKNVSKLDSLVYKDKHIDLIACIDMLNMGYHIDSLTGIVMYRGTHSNTIFTQQFGRSLSAGSNAPGIVFDVVDNLHRKAIYDVKVSLTDKPLRKGKGGKQRKVAENYVQDKDDPTKILFCDGINMPEESPYHVDENGKIVDSNGVPAAMELDPETGIVYDISTQTGKDINRITKECLNVTGHEAVYREIIAKAVAEPITQRCKMALELHFRTWCLNNGIEYPITDRKMKDMYGLTKQDFYAEFCKVLKRKKIAYPLQDAEQLLAIGAKDSNVALEICANARNTSVQQILDVFGIAN